MPTGSQALARTVKKPSLYARLMGFLFAFILRAWSHTCAVRSAGLDRLDKDLEDKKPMIIAFWHEHYVLILMALMGRHGLIFTSRSRRGSVIGEIAHHLGISSVEIPHSGFRQMIDTARTQCVVAMAVDGPEGPYHAVKRGPVQLAAELGWPIVPVAAQAPRGLSLHRWDRLRLPLPFTRIGVVVGEPLKISTEQTQPDTETNREKVREALSRCEIRANVLIERTERP